MGARRPDRAGSPESLPRPKPSQIAAQAKQFQEMIAEQLSPIGEDHGEFVYDTIKKGSARWTATVQFKPLSRNCEVAEYTHEVYVDEGGKPLVMDGSIDAL